MSIYTQHRKWGLETGYAFSASAGPVGLSISNFSLVGDKTERLDMSFIGAGTGWSVSVNHRGEAIDERASVDPGIIPCFDAATDIIFAGPTRSGQNFDGWGYILDASATSALYGVNAQMLIFNLAVSPLVVAHAAELLWQYHIGAIRSLHELRRVAPAIALTASALRLGTSISGSVNIYHGRWNVTEPGSGPYVPRQTSAQAGPSTFLY